MTTPSRPSRPLPHRPARPVALLLVAVLALTGLLAGCSASSDDSASSADTSSDTSSGSAGSSAGGAAPQEVAAPAEALADSEQGAAAGDSRGGLALTSEKAVISTGTVSLRSGDVGQLLFDVQKAADQYAAEVSQRASESDDEGDVLRSRLVLRVPAESFGDLMGALEQTGTLISSDSSSEDVTAQVIDNDVRVGVQRASIRRIQALLAQAVDLEDVVSIEAELSARQAELNSLEQTQAYLADQTSRSTITVALERTRPSDAPREEQDDSGFLTGLSAGWEALSGFGTALATVAGALLPWVLAGSVVTVPVAVAARRLRRRTTIDPTPAGGPAPTV